MTTNRLIEISSQPLLGGGCTRDALESITTRFGSMGGQLLELLAVRNGFFVFESALLVRGLGRSNTPRDLMSWNDEKLWISQYAALCLPDLLFFAEDVFGNQFAIGQNGVVAFDPETGEVAEMAATIDEWCGLLLSDFKFHTGYPLAHAWQRANGPLAPGTRLIPVVPFVAGGAYSLENLRVIEDLPGMLFRADFANQIRNLPDGAEIRFQTDDER